MSCCIPETLNLLWSLMAERGGIQGRFTSSVLENPAAWLLHRQGVTSTDKGKPRSAPVQDRRGPSPSPRGMLWQKRWVVCRESSSALAHAAQHQNHLPARRHNLMALFCSLLAPSPAPLSSRLTSSPPCPRLSPAALSGILAHSLKDGVQEGWSSPPSLDPHHDRSSPTAVLHYPATSPLRSPSQAAASPGPAAGRDPRDEESPAERTPQPPCRGAPTPSPGWCSKASSREKCRTETGRVWPGGNLSPVVGINSVPGSVSWHRRSILAQAPCPCAATPAAAAAGLPSLLQLPHPSQPKPGLDPRPFQRRMAKNPLRLLPGRAGWRGRGSWEVSRCTHTRAHAHTALHIGVHTHTQPHTHPLSLHRCRCTSSIFCAPAPTMQDAGSAPRAPARPRRRQPALPVPPGARGTERGGTACPAGRDGLRGRAPTGSDPFHRHHGPGRCDCPGTGTGRAGPAGPVPAGRRLRPRQGPGPGRVPRCRSVGFGSPLSAGTPSSRGAGAAEPRRRAPGRAWRSQRRG